MSTSTAPSAPVLFTKEQSIQNIILNRPQAYNALTLEMVELMLTKMRVAGVYDRLLK
jgi:enoyl-CoA hydratase/carnithine racemase